MNEQKTEGIQRRFADNVGDSCEHCCCFQRIGDYGPMKGKCRLDNFDLGEIYIHPAGFRTCNKFLREPY